MQYMKSERRKTLSSIRATIKVGDWVAYGNFPGRKPVKWKGDKIRIGVVDDRLGSEDYWPSGSKVMPLDRIPVTWCKRDSRFPITFGPDGREKCCVEAKDLCLATPDEVEESKRWQT